MFCENCGALIPEGSKFCENCGTRVPEVPDIAAQLAAAEKYQAQFTTGEVTSDVPAGCPAYDSKGRRLYYPDPNRFRNGRGR